MTLADRLRFDYHIKPSLRFDEETGECVVDASSKGYLPLQMEVLNAHREAWRNKALVDPSIPTDSVELDLMYNANDLSRLYKIVLFKLTFDPESDISKIAEKEFSGYVDRCLELNRDVSHKEPKRDSDHHYLLETAQKSLFKSKKNPDFRDITQEDIWLINNYIAGRVVFNSLKRYVKENGSHVQNNPELDVILLSPSETENYNSQYSRVA